MPNNNSLTIILIKNEYVEFNQIIRDDIEDLKSFPLENIGTVYFVNSNVYPPTWTSSFFLNDDGFQNKLWNSSSKATLLLKIHIDESNEDRIFALVFGRGGSLVKDTVIEDRFGLRTALNLIGESNIRNISKTIIGGSQKNTIEQMPKQSSIDEFEFDMDTDLITKITGKVLEDKLIKGTITGSDSLSLKHEVDISNIKRFLSRIHEYYQSKDYLSFFEWIDQVKIVKNKLIIELLDQKLVEKVNEKNNEFWMAVPEIIEWDEVKGFKISAIRNEIFDDIYIDKVIDSLKDALTEIDQLKNKTITLIDLNDQSAFSWSAYKCIYGEISFNGSSYVINGGKWYEIDTNYASRLEKQYRESFVSSIDFIDSATHQREDDYNIKQTNSDSSNFLCLDKKLISVGSSHNKIEICDILSRNAQLIHVKKYSGSSVLSHLFNQGLVSATLLKKGDENFITKGNQKIGELTSDPEFILDMNKPYEIVFGIISKDNEDLPNIPFFSKISFCSVREKLKLYGYTCSIKAIRKTATR